MSHRQVRRLNTVRSRKNFQHFIEAFNLSEFLSVLSSCQLRSLFIYIDNSLAYLYSLSSGSSTRSLKPSGNFYVQKIARISF